MNGPSGFQEVRSSTSRSSTNRLLRKQQPQFGTGAWHRFRTHDRIACSTDINQSEKRFLTPFSCRVSFVTLILVLVSVQSFAQTEITLNSRTVKPSKASTEEFVRTLQTAPSGTHHGLARFVGILTEANRQILARLGIHVLELFNKTTYWVRVTKGDGLRQALDLNMDLIELRDEDRVEPGIWREEYERYMVASRGKEPRNYVLNDDGTVNLTVQFHADVPEADARRVLQRYTQKLRKKSAVMWIAVIPRMKVRALATEDRVQWIEAGPLPFLPENNESRSLLGVDPLQEFKMDGTLNGLGGSDVWVGIFDDGIDEHHSDFEDRIWTSPDAIGPNTHGTHIAGTVASKGWLSGSPCSLIVETPCNSTPPPPPPPRTL
jgi:hypothetical protein